MMHDFIVPFLKDTDQIRLSGNGEPFASQHNRRIMKATKGNITPSINLHTNAMLCDERNWRDYRSYGRVNEIHVSIDAATPKTNAAIRRGGVFVRLLRNLELIAFLRSTGEINRIKLSFVIQAVNFREMPAFVALGRQFGADEVFFSNIQLWTQAKSADQYRAVQVWRNDHPMNPELITIMREKKSNDPIVSSGNLSDKAAPSYASMNMP